MEPDGIDQRSMVRPAHDETVAAIGHVGVRSPDAVGFYAQQTLTLSLRQHQLLAGVERKAQFVSGVDAYPLELVHARRRAEWD